MPKPLGHAAGRDNHSGHPAGGLTSTIGVGAANRDEAVFDAPDEFRVDRDPNPHLAFGIGTHYCLGANLARAEIKVVFEELFRRLRDIRAVDPDTLERGDSTLVLALDRLPAVFTPETPVPPEAPGPRP